MRGLINDVYQYAKTGRRQEPALVGPTDVGPPEGYRPSDGHAGAWQPFQVTANSVHWRRLCEPVAALGGCR